MYLSFNSFEKEYNVTLEGALQHSISVGADIQGNITRLDNLISRLPDRLEACKEKLAETEKQIENAKAEIARPFPKEQELKEKSERLAELNALLDMDHKDNEIVDGETLDQKESRETTKEIGRT
jgi:predicted RNase H-like nuclease (RuvC/YqgF family)